MLLSPPCFISTRWCWYVINDVLCLPNINLHAASILCNINTVSCVDVFRRESFVGFWVSCFYLTMTLMSFCLQTRFACCLFLNIKWYSGDFWFISIFDLGWKSVPVVCIYYWWASVAIPRFTGFGNEIFKNTKLAKPNRSKYRNTWNSQKRLCLHE